MVQCGARENEATRELHRLGFAAVRQAPDAGVAFAPGDTERRDDAVDVVLFDRFFVEELAGHHVGRDSFRIVDSQDLHFLRGFREARVTADASACPAEAFAAAPDPETDPAMQRELAAYHRADAVLAVSAAEAARLAAVGLPPHKVLRVPLLLSAHAAAEAAAAEAAAGGFADRYGFVFIGNMRHAPNRDGLRWLLAHVWPRVRAALPRARLRVHGAYMRREEAALVREAPGVEGGGFVPSQFAALAAARVQLAPLRFGAGCKGKVTDAWAVGTPTVTTPVGSEGLDAAEEAAVAAAAAALTRDGPCREGPCREGPCRGATVVGESGLARSEPAGACRRLGGAAAAAVLPPYDARAGTEAVRVSSAPPWGGVATWDPADMAAAAVALHEDADRWAAARGRGKALLLKLCDREEAVREVLTAVPRDAAALAAWRARDPVGSVVRGATLRYTGLMAQLVAARQEGRRSSADGLAQSAAPTKQGGGKEGV